MINKPSRVGWCFGQTGGYEFNTKSSDIKVERSRHENDIEKRIVKGVGCRKAPVSCNKYFVTSIFLREFSGAREQCEMAILKS